MQELGKARSVAWNGIQVEGAEGFSGWNQGYTDWEVFVPMQLQRGVRLGSQTTYAALLVSGSEVSITWKLRLKVQVEY